MQYKRFDIRYLVRKKGGPTKIALECRVSNSTVSQWLRVNSVSREHALHLAKVWNLNPDWLHNPWGLQGQVMTEQEMDDALHGIDPNMAPKAAPKVDAYAAPMELDREAMLEEYCRETGYLPGVSSVRAPEELRGEWRQLGLDYRRLQECSDAEAREILAEVAGMAALRELGGE